MYSLAKFPYSPYQPNIWLMSADTFLHKYLDLATNLLRIYWPSKWHFCSSWLISEEICQLWMGGQLGLLIPPHFTMAGSKFCHWCEMGFFKKSPLHADSCFYKSRPPKRKFEEVEPQRERIVVKLRRVISPNLWGLPACWAPDVWEVVTN